MERTTTEVLDEVLMGLELAANHLQLGRPRSALRVLKPIAVTLREMRYELWQTEEVIFGFRGDDLRKENALLQERVEALKQEVRELRDACATQASG